jgi:hypothetical protein
MLGDDVPRWYRKHHKCVCGEEWEDEWSCLCDDECPRCGKDIEPDAWEEVEMSPEEIRRLIS